jgi:hypothetical protein
MATPGFTRNNSAKNTIGPKDTEHNSDSRHVRNSSEMCSPTELHKVNPPKVHSINRIARTKVTATLVDKSELEIEKQKQLERERARARELLAMQYNRNEQPSSSHLQYDKLK